MSSIVYVPSSLSANVAPQSSTVKSANYTVPAGKYARVIPVIDIVGEVGIISAKNYTQADVSLSLNSEPIYFYGLSFSGSVTRSSAGTTGYSLTVPHKGEVVYTMANTGATSLTVLYSRFNNIPCEATVTTSLAVTSRGIRDSFFVSLTTSVAGTFIGYYTIRANPVDNITNSFWVPTGGVLSVSATLAPSYIVEEYNV